jgi:hypothetical protein
MKTLPYITLACITSFIIVLGLILSGGNRIYAEWYGCFIQWPGEAGLMGIWRCEDDHAFCYVRGESISCIKK